MVGNYDAASEALHLGKPAVTDRPRLTPLNHSFTLDANLYGKSERAGKRVMKSVSQFLTRKLKLTVNGEKSAVARPWERKFLGFTFTAGGKPKRRIAPQALTRFKARVRQHTNRTRGISLERMTRELRPYLVGWRNYFGFCEVRSILTERTPGCGAGSAACS